MRPVALIFGGSGGIGQEISSILAINGMTVYSTSYHKKVSSQIPHILHCDIIKNKDIRQVIAHILKKENRLDIVINSVSPHLKLKTIEELSTSEFKEDLDTILIGGINIAKAIMPVMKTKRSGIIINILSALVIGNVSTRMSTYISAKYGLAGFTKCLALELKPFNISVFGISPSYVETSLIKSFPGKLIELEKIKRRSGKLIQPIEVARVVLDVIQNPHNYKSGENIKID